MTSNKAHERNTVDNKIESTENWLSTDELNEALNALLMVKRWLPNVTSDVYYWKWVIIALHNGLQGFMVCALRGSNGLNVLKTKCRDKWLEAYENNSDSYPVKRMDLFPNLYEKIKGKDMRMFVHSRQFMPQGQQDQSVDKLNMLRNEFIHFLPKLWSLEVSGLPQIVKDCVMIIKFLVFDSGNVIVEIEQGAQVKKAIENIENELGKLESAYGR